MTNEPHNSKPTLTETVSIGSMCLMILLVLMRAMSSHEPFPMWETDPFLFSLPLTGISYGYGVLLNTLVMFFGLVVLLTTRSPDLRSEKLLNILAAFGFAGLGFFLISDPQSLLNSSTIGAMMTALLASRCFLSARPEWIKVCIPLVLGSAVVFAVIGAHQVFIQHPQTVSMYDETKDAFLEARGWTDGSFEVLSYERRLRQPEPTGWFGLSNVYASFIAAFAVAIAMVTLCSIRKAWWILSALVAGALLAMLAISKSKGGIGAAALGFATLQYVLLRRSGRPRRLGWSTASACVFVMAGVVGGAVMHQLSLLFRGQYMVGALRVFAEHPLLGVGPGRFQEAYMVSKPSTSPEDVTSAHNLVFDLLAQLGIPGIALIATLCIVLLTARLPDSDGEQTQTSLASGIRTRVILLTVLIVGAGAIRLQSNAMDLELMLLLMCGIIGWIVMSVLLGLLGNTRTLRLAMTGAAVVLSLHAMLDLTPIWIVSGPLFGLCIGMGFISTQRLDSEPKLSASKLVLMVVLATSVVFGGMGAAKGIARDQQLISLGTPAQEIVAIRDMIEDRMPGEEITQRITDLLGPGNSSNQPSLLQALDQFEIQTRYESALGLMMLTEDFNDRAVDITALEQVMKSAMILDRQGLGESNQLWDWIAETAQTLSTRNSFTERKWAGQAYITIARNHSSDPSKAIEQLTRGFDAWTAADTLNPHDPKHAYRLMELSAEIGDLNGAKKWAAEAIERSGRMRLDPLKQLNATSLKRARDLVDSQ